MIGGKIDAEGKDVRVSQAEEKGPKGMNPAWMPQKITSNADGLERVPNGVNDRNWFLFISHIGDIYPSGFLPVKAGNMREQ